ncbi:SMP-30/gluconolactonase/LRE family protein [Streptomyces sp. NPDC048304]|uniref:SMP-30/gluconolactonase/LRE family protein n=1 Tax=Streptomyces sp. NPDC048304 TaxID=3154820 RepID=UPI00340556BF
MDRPTALVPLHYVSLGGHGPEDVAVDAHGRVLTGVADGRILRVHHLGDPRTARVEVLAETGGRPLGLEPLPDGGLLVCDAERGLLRVDPDPGSGSGSGTGTGTGRTVRVLADSVAGEPLRFCSNAVALPDGTVYVTVSSRRYPLDQWIGDIVEHTGTGRLLRVPPEGGEPEVLLGGLQFANGLAVGADGSFLVIAETGACRLTRYHLTGPRAGHADLFATLPGMPDNLWREGPGGPLWVALPSPRVPPLELLHRASPAVRGAAARAAVHAPYRPSGTIGVMALDDAGRTVAHLTRRRSGFRMVTSVCATGDHLVLGSLWEPGVAVCARPAAR